ncbi:hypothetical protein KVR01_007949 [Diaporthe batatas]|uniref:uncharacterized protein n=1 Tax=Diaporthe batatas TaxID=748121 RepID=UPI001D05BD04|nr:uncharacterized protein KVR01_007949 [Diaporthe batatas]KAG8162184.1 hypothetical protein KVR01_007949 [Diaporthe batatas]
MNNDIYASSDSSSDDGSDGQNVSISDITNRVNLEAIRIQLTYYGRPADPRLPAPWRDAQGRFNKYIPAWMDNRVTPWPLRHPALRPDNAWQKGDDWLLPTEYAKRFGTDPRAPRDNPARSMLTPNAEGPDAEWSEDYQAVVFHGFTADELKTQGAFDPDMRIDGSLDGLAGSPIHPMLRRGHWYQEPDEGRSSEQCKLWYNFNGQDRRWDAGTNDEVWGALQPVLRLMSKVLYSQHPFWRSMCDIYKLKPMDMSRVPVPPPNAALQPEEGAAPPIPQEFWDRLSTLHYEVEDRDMYPEAKALRDSGFQAEQVVNNILRAYVRFTFTDTVSDGAYAWTRVRLGVREGVSDEILVELSPESVWPLILPSYSKSEKFVVATALAGVILHELAHCARNAIFIMTEREDWEKEPSLRTAGPDDDGDPAPELTQVTDEQKQLLLQLGRKMGSLGIPTPGRVAMFPAFFFQDEYRSEEGWAFENQLWGGVINTMAEIAPRDGFPQVIGWLEKWPYPTKAPRPWFNAGPTSHGEIDDFGWPGWLLDPPPTVVERNTALPVAMMSRLHDESFWDTQFARFGHEALRYAVHQWEGRPLRSSFSYTHLPLDVMRRALGPARGAAWRWLEAAEDLLSRGGEPVLAEWLLLLASDAAGPALVRRRFRVEARRWRTADAAARAAARRLDGLVTAARARLSEWQRPAEGDGSDSGGVGGDTAARRAAYLEQARLIANAGLDAARSLGWEVSSMQYSAAECGRLAPRRRGVLRRPLARCGARVERWFKPLLALAAAAVEEVRAELNTPRSPGPPATSSGQALARAAAEADYGRRRGVVVARLDAAHGSLAATRALVDELGRVVDELWRASGPAPVGHGRPSRGRGAAAPAPAPAPARYSFTLLAERSSDRLRRNRLERLAQHRLRELPWNSPGPTLARAACRILERCVS